MEAMTRHFLEMLGRNSVEAGIMVLVVLLAQWLAGKKIAPRWRCALWLLVMVRLLLPVSVSSVTSVFNLFPHLENQGGSGAAGGGRLLTSSAIGGGEPLTSSPAGTLGRDGSETSGGRLTSSPTGGGDGERLTSSATGERLVTSSPAGAREISWWVVMFAIWAGGILFFGGYIVVSSFNLRRQFAILTRVTDGELLELLRDCRERLGIRGGLWLAESPDLATPALYGFLRPKLLLPRGFAGRFSKQELRFICIRVTNPVW
jgi:bla regulator protein BlaR1